MLTYTTQLTTYQGWTDDSSENEANGIAWLNDSIRTICNLQGGKLRFLEDTADVFTIANQEAYETPNKFRKIIDMWVFSGDGSDSSQTIYSPEMVFDPTKWKTILQYRYGTQDVPYFTYVQNQKFLVQPIPATTGQLMRIRGRLNVRDLTIPDYTIGTIVSIANGATTLTGSGTSWNSSMVGRYIQIPNTNTTNTGDGFWYQIASVTSTTVLELVKKYEGTSIAAGTATYTMGQVSVIPEAYQMGIVYRASALYWEDKSEKEKAKRFWLRYDGGNEAGYVKEGYGGLIGQMLDNEGETEEGSYVPSFASGTNLPQAPYYFPNQQATGF